MKSLIHLELRKQRKSFFGLLFIIVFSITILNAIASHIERLAVGDAFVFIVVLLQAVGLPFFALLLGGSSGAVLRSSRNAEENIPVGPMRRVYAAYIASLGYLVLLTSILFALSSPIEYSISLQSDFYVPLMMAVLLPLHAASFVFSYWLSQALLGSVVSAMIIGIPAYIFSLDSFCEVPDLSVTTYIALSGVIAMGIYFSLIVWLTNTIEREKSIRLPIKIGISSTLVAAFLISVWGIFFISNLISSMSISNEELTVYPYNETRIETIYCH
ncbi:MAG TPA: hypothetical protein VH815_05750 [Acidobacteriota bacterium]